ncbi:MAG: hypothetical protein JOZ18_10600 [Chloroflexi bacterium]|nr:hypothetical protein [Chloroflexota bacterium]
MEIKDIEQRIALVTNDREHGSRWLVRETILILRDLAQAQLADQDEQMRLLYSKGRDLSQARPAMAALSAAVGRILSVQGSPAAIAQAANHLLEEYETATKHIATHAEPYLYGHLMTCSLSGTVLEVLAAQRSHIEHITVLEGRPRYEGREMARALSQHGITITLITDAEADIFMPQCQAVVVGADSILADGDILNKAGTALLAWSAHGHGIPFYVLSETLKISSHRWSTDKAHLADNLSLLEEKEPEEVLEQPIPTVSVRNFYFDRTPYKLISKLISERGILEQQTIREIAASVQRNEQLLARTYL